MRKLLIWDGDETLWNGTVLEYKIVQLPEGRRELCEELARRGVLQAVASKNLQRDVDDVLKKLGLNMFLHSVGDLDMPKSQMVKNIIHAYGLSDPRDVVYVDDLLFNVEEVRKNVPGVHGYLHKGDHLDAVVYLHFTKDRYTKEDQLRVRSYEAEANRKRASESYGGDHLAFLESCKMKMKISRCSVEDTERVKDLARRAHRMSAFDHDFRDLETDWTRNCLVAHVADTYGDYGLSGFVWTPTAGFIAGLVISCRLQGRGVGSALLGAVINLSHNPNIRASWVETEYNKGIRALYEWYKFGISNLTDEQVVASLYKEGPVVTPPWIALEVNP